MVMGCVPAIVGYASAIFSGRAMFAMFVCWSAMDFFVVMMVVVGSVASAMCRWRWHVRSMLPMGRRSKVRLSLAMASTPAC